MPIAVTVRITATDAKSVQLARRWFVWDGLRLGLIATGFVASVRALNVPDDKRDVSFKKVAPDSKQQPLN